MLHETSLSAQRTHTIQSLHDLAESIDALEHLHHLLCAAVDADQDLDPVRIRRLLGYAVTDLRAHHSAAERAIRPDLF